MSDLYPRKSLGISPWSWYSPWNILYCTIVQLYNCTTVLPVTELEPGREVGQLVLRVGGGEAGAVLQTHLGGRGDALLHLVVGLVPLTLNHPL